MRRRPVDGADGVDDRLGGGARAQFAAQIGGHGARGQNGGDGGLDRIRLVLQLQAVTQQQGRRQDGPDRIGQILTENMFGDILSDEISVLGGSIGLLPSASLGTAGPGLFEPIHGSAPDIAGQDLANPVGMVLSAAMMLRHSFDLEDEADSIEAAVAVVLASGAVTADLGGALGTVEATRAIVDAIRAIHWAAARHVPMHWA